MIREKKEEKKKQTRLPPQKFPIPPSPDNPPDPLDEFRNSSIYLCDMWLLSYRRNQFGFC